MAEGVIRGVVGKVRWSYYDAATVEGYTVTCAGTKAQPKWSLRGTVVLSDAFKMRQRPLLFVAPHKKGEWRWPIREMEVINGQVVAQLGPPDR